MRRTEGEVDASEVRSNDELDSRLLILLRENSRRQVSALAATLGVSRATVYARIARFEKEGIVEGYTIRMGREHDRKLVRAHVMIKLIPKLTQETVTELEGLRGVTALYSISGEHDLIAAIEGSNLGELDALIDEIGLLDGVEKTTSSVILSTKFVR